VCSQLLSIMSRLFAGSMGSRCCQLGGGRQHRPSADRRKLYARAETGTLGRVVSPSSRGAGPQEAPRIDSRDQPPSARERRSTYTATRRQGRKRISLATWKEPSDPFMPLSRAMTWTNFRIVAETEGLGGIPIIAIAHLMRRVRDCFRTSTDTGPGLQPRS
jgi:hypothetical protein